MNQRPLSPYVQVGGLYFFARSLDKIRLHARGALHPEHHGLLGKGFDGRLCTYLRIDYAALQARTLAGGTDEEILAWTQAQGRTLNDVDILAWNAFTSKRGWRDEATPMLEKQKAESGLADRTDLVTFFEFWEVDEGRKPRHLAASPA